MAFKHLMAGTVIAIDFDGTIVHHRFPDMGKPIPGAFRVIKRLIDDNCKIILLTMRSGETLKAAMTFIEQYGITLWAVNENPEQSSWTDSPKVFAHKYIDDAAVGCPLKTDGKRAFVDWDRIERMIYGDVTTSRMTTLKGR